MQSVVVVVQAFVSIIVRKMDAIGRDEGGEEVKKEEEEDAPHPLERRGVRDGVEREKESTRERDGGCTRKSY